MGSKGGGSTTTVQKADPWAGQQPYLRDIFSEAKNLYDSGQMAPSYYGGSTVAPQSAWTEQALAMQARRALGGSPSVSAAQSAVDGIVAGGALAGNAGLGRLESLAQSDLNAGNAGLAALESMAQAQNPYVDALYQDASREALSAINGNFSRAGRYGSGAHAAASAEAATDLASQMYGAAYGQSLNAASQAASAYNAGLGQQIGASQGAGSLYHSGVGQQIAGAGMAQQLAGQAYTDAAALAQAGAAQEGWDQRLINADIERWNYEQQQALNALNNYNQIIQGNYGSSTTTTTTGQQPSSAGSVLGGVSAGAGIGAAVGGLPGGIIGALGGGLLSLF